MFGVPNGSKVRLTIRIKLFLVPPKVYIIYIKIHPTIIDFQSHVLILCRTKTDFSPTKITFSAT